MVLQSRRRRTRPLLAAVLLTLSTGSPAADDADTSSPSAWGGAALAKILASPIKGGVVPTRMVIAAGDQPWALEKAAPAFDVGTYGAASFLDLVAADEAQLAYRLNHGVEPTKREESARRLMLLSRSDLGVVSPPLAGGEGAEIVTWGEAATAALEPVARLPKLPDDEAALAKQVAGALGYTGVVLAQQGSRIVALTPIIGRDKKKHSQAMALKGSAALVKVGGDQRAPLAILDLVATDGHYSIYKLGLTVGADKVSLPAGTKLVVEGY